MKVPEGRRLTNYWTATALEIGSVSCTYTYKRDDFQLQIAQNRLHFLSYLPSNSPYFYANLTNSGQISIILALQYLNKHWKVNKICSLSSPYIGTQDACKYLEIELTNDTQPDLWICSSTHKDIFYENYFSRPWRNIVIDSTCWHLQEAPFEKLIEKLEFEHLIIVRSISKLDMGGVESGSLGSIVCFSKRKQDFTIWKELYKYFAAAPSISDISPSLFNQSAFLENIKRCKQIKINYDFLVKGITERLSFLKVATHEHKKYLTIQFEKKYPREKLRSNLLFFFKFNNIEFRSVRSFGFNFWNFDFYSPVDDESLCLRIAPSSSKDFGSVEKIITSIDLALRKIKQS
ncbi:MAG: hypothetical protein VYA54_06810 [Bdellovibrionota bacterium]|nr:hypothetical protein [Bdellovibrionota bacterium]